MEKGRLNLTKNFQICKSNNLRLFISTWCHCSPREIPACFSADIVCLGENVHHAAFGGNDWRLEIISRSWIFIATTALVHQNGAIAICDFYIVKLTIPNPSRPRLKCKVSKLQLQYLITCNIYGLSLLQVMGVIIRIVCRGENSCVINAYRLYLKSTTHPHYHSPEKDKGANTSAAIFRLQ